ncbi:IclR family transcriptional regulator [uncultured Nitratireductor sp.]|uniref:IclR family transcriptional regulator n=1 Tax=uncultured Nitratireductor sp. TaxID=520953 RepID=UPI0025ED81B5|nr:IclR family transcriptional regulator [uncultured Nitratireductor sp.]
MAPQINGSVVKAFTVLKLFSEQRPELTASEVARETGMNGITAHRFLRTLEHVGALVAVSKGVYRLGYVFADLGDRVLQNDALARLLQPHLNALSEELREATMATVFRSDMVYCIARATSARSLSVEIRVGSQLDGYCTAHGKTWLAFMPEHERQRYLETVERVRFTKNTITDLDALNAELEIVRRQGYAINNSEREDGIRAVAVPVRTRTGRMIAGLSAFGPSTRFTEKTTEKALVALRAAALQAENSLYGDEGEGAE